MKDLKLLSMQSISIRLVFPNHVEGPGEVRLFVEVKDKGGDFDCLASDLSRDVGALATGRYVSESSRDPYSFLQRLSAALFEMDWHVLHVALEFVFEGQSSRSSCSVYFLEDTTKQ